MHIVSMDAADLPASEARIASVLLDTLERARSNPLHFRVPGRCGASRSRIIFWIAGALLLQLAARTNGSF